MPWIQNETSAHTCDVPPVHDSWYSGDRPDLGKLWQCGHCAAIWKLTGTCFIPSEPGDPESWRLSFVLQDSRYREII